MALSDFFASLGNGISKFVGGPQGSQPSQTTQGFSLDPIAQMVQLLGGINSRKQTNQAITTNNVATPAETQSNALYTALADPNSPIVNNLAAANKTQNLADFQTQLNEMQLAQRRNAVMGRGGAFFNPERSDEAMSYLMSRGVPQITGASRQQAIDQITRAASGVAGSVQPQIERSKINMGQGISNSAYAGGVPSTILDILRSLGGNSPNGGNGMMTNAPISEPEQQFGTQMQGNYGGYTVPNKNNPQQPFNQFRSGY